MKILMKVMYDGYDFLGFQKQKGENNTVQGKIESALKQIYSKDIKIYGSGRTDRYVHALNQTFSFEIDDLRYPLDRLIYSLNKILGDSIVIKEGKIMDDENFHARFNAKGKHYRYVLSLKRNPFYRRYALYYPFKLDKEKILKATKLFIGKHDFFSFCSPRDEKDYFETIFKFDFSIKDDLAFFDIEGTGFKRYMVRMIVGTVLAYNEGKIELDYLTIRLNDDHFEKTSWCVEGHGLYLMEVFYD